jgi:hypothetical protein
MHITRKKIMIGLAASALAIVAVFGAAGFGAYQYVSAKFIPAASGPGTQGSSIFSDYWTVFLKNFAAKLGVDQDKLDQAYNEAVAATVDQAVKDGKLTQAQADNIKSENNQGLTGAKGMNPFGRGFGPERGLGGKGGFHGDGITTADIATALGMSEADVTSGFQAGKSIADLAKAQNVDLAKVKDALLAAQKARLDKDVAAGSLTQAQADAMYQKLTTSMDTMLNQTGVFSHKGGRH